jgi:hypothetical protein
MVPLRGTEGHQAIAKQAEKPVKKKIDQTLTKLANAAFQRAAEKVIDRAEDAGTPVIVWQHEAVTELDPRNTRARRNGHAPKK